MSEWLVPILGLIVIYVIGVRARQLPARFRGDYSSKNKNEIEKGRKRAKRGLFFVAFFLLIFPFLVTRPLKQTKEKAVVVIVCVAAATLSVYWWQAYRTLNSLLKERDHGLKHEKGYK